MAHNHDHSHSHNHGEPVRLSEVNKAFIIGISLNLLYVLVQIVVGFKINSLSLLSDAGHNFLDVAGLALSLLAFKLNKVKATEKYTYGYRKSSILISLLNAVVLLISIGAIGYEAILRFSYPEPLPGKTIAIIALIGIFINGISAFMFFKDKDKDINIKSAFLHLLSDALVSGGLVVGGIIIYFTNWFWIDPLLSLIICFVIITSTWSLLKDSLRLSLDGVPDGVQLNEIKDKILTINDVKGFHHVHIWAISTSENALTAHVVVPDGIDLKGIESLKHKVKHALEHFNIQHATLEIESETENCETENC